MKVWVVYETVCDGCENKDFRVLGVYSSREKALQVSVPENRKSRVECYAAKFDVE